MTEVKSLLKNINDGKNTTKFLEILFTMSEDPTNREEIISQSKKKTNSQKDGIEILLNVLKEEDLEAINQACGALGNLCNSKEVREEIIEEKGGKFLLTQCSAEKLIKLFKHKDEELNIALVHVWVVNFLKFFLISKNLAKSSQARKIWLKKNGLDVFLPFLASKDKKLVKLTLQSFVSFLTDGKIKLTTKNEKKIFVSKSKILKINLILLLKF
jgi:hypothetical protein